MTIDASKNETEQQEQAAEQAQELEKQREEDGTESSQGRKNRLCELSLV
jgi:hypothetical protein